MQTIQTLPIRTRLCSSFCNCVLFHICSIDREGEQNGVHYHFVPLEDMEAAIGRGEFVEYARVHTNMYGTSIKAIGDVSIPLSRRDFKIPSLEFFLTILCLRTVGTIERQDLHFRHRHPRCAKGERELIAMQIHLHLPALYGGTGISFAKSRNRNGRQDPDPFENCAR